MAGQCSTGALYFAPAIRRASSFPSPSSRTPIPSHPLSSSRSCRLPPPGPPSQARTLNHCHQSCQLKPPLFQEVSRMAGRQARTTNVVMGGTATEYGDDWLELDKKVNTYPSLRDFTAIGLGGEDFAVAMVLAVQSVLPKDVPELQVVTRESATGRYISVKIGPVRMDSSEQSSDYVFKWMAERHESKVERIMLEHKIAATKHRMLEEMKQNQAQ
ncbi:unnamed protein product [Closterium sp. Naga37s-1]|nr:unnamed protein product [Closterium sp. Naga37s-1]